MDYELSCHQCPDWSECEDCWVSDPESYHACADVLEYTSSPEADGTLASLTLEGGFWRTSNTSTEVLECHNADACSGGEAPSCGDANCLDGYCAAGYTGPCEGVHA